MTYGPEYPVPLLGPCRCIGCGEPLYWAARNTRRMGITILKTAWREEDGALHRCPEWQLALANGPRISDNTGVGSSDESDTIANGALVSATTGGEGVTAFRGSSS